MRSAGGAVERSGGRPAPSSADVRFMQGMIAHHAQAIAMSSLVPARTTRRDIHLLAQRITISQRDEIALMQRWLRDRHEEVPSADTLVHRHAGRMAPMPGMPAAGHDVLMPGMLTDDEMAQLAGATGPDFDRLFLRFMIRHHEGALTMVANLFATPGGAQDPEVFTFANDVDADQRAEIARMQALLDASPSPAPRRE